MPDNEEFIPSNIGKLLKISYLPGFSFGIPVHKPYIG